MVRLKCEFDSRCRLSLRRMLNMITIGAVLLIVLTYALVTAVNFFKDTELSKEAKEKMLDKSFRAAFITVIAGWIVFEMLIDRKSTRLNSSHVSTSYAVF